MFEEGKLFNVYRDLILISKISLTHTDLSN